MRILVECRALRNFYDSVSENEENVYGLARTIWFQMNIYVDMSSITGEGGSIREKGGEKETEQC